MTSTQWPTTISDAARELLGPDMTAEPLGGMSGAGVQRLRGNGLSAVLKQSSLPNEWHVYTQFAGRLHAAGVALPRLHAGAFESNIWWLLLEDIPRSLPQERWLADAEVLEMLHRLHAIPIADLPLPESRFRPGWSADLTRQALSLFEPDDARHLEPLLADIRKQAARLFEPVCVISGDPNPANWGIRNDGSLVLFDWERCTLGHPAVDLAITVPGLGDMAAFEQVAGRYAAGDVARAKVWTVVEILAGCADGSVVPSFDVSRLVGQIPTWLGSLFRTNRGE